MRLETVLFLLLSGHWCYCSKKSKQDREIEYYKNLILKEQAKSLKHELPTDNNRFMGDKTELNQKPVDFGNYDIIIVGAGSAGSVLARRLTEVKQWKVLVIEAGGEENDFNQIPLMEGNLQGLPDMNWGYYTIPQDTCCLGMFTNACNYPKGIGFGGTSRINALMYVRGNHRDYDEWADHGNPGWSYKDVLPYFIRSENVQQDVLADPGYHGIGGPLEVDYAKPGHPFLKPFFEAHEELGIKNVDYNGVEQIGYSRVQFNLKKGHRWSTAKAFLNPARNRPNLTLKPHSLVTRVLIDKNKKACGVEFVNDGVRYQATAEKEVILSAGAVNSPQILLLSGIGPYEELDRLNIKIIEDLPVGKYLKDHPTLYAITFDTNVTMPNNPLEKYIKEFLYGYGPLTSPADVEGIGFAQVPSRSSPPGFPDIEYVYMPQYYILPTFIEIMFNYNTENILHYLAKIQPTRMITVFVTLLHPYSYGNVTLKSSSPFEHPNINLGLFSDPDDKDLETLYEGVQAVFKVFKTKPFKRYNTKLLDAGPPACGHLPYLSKQYWKCFIQQLSGTFYHTTGTTRMGPEGRSNSVVNHKLKVHGVDNLRVVDAGVIPFQPSGHTNAITIMVAEKGADIIKRDHGVL